MVQDKECMQVKKECEPTPLRFLYDELPSWRKKKLLTNYESSVTRGTRNRFYSLLRGEYLMDEVEISFFAHSFNVPLQSVIKNYFPQV